ncbi:MAG: hypothetical protein IJY08_01615 [Clostridia bacterium]|nr:hypothetical protein [Clostridia bacterium]
MKKNIKKTLIAFILLFSVLLSACKRDTTSPDDTSTPDIDINDTAYETIERYDAVDYSSHHFAFRGDNHALRLSVPSEWSFTEQSGGYDISRDGERLGALVAGEAADADSWQILKSDTASDKDVTMQMSIEASGAEGEVRYRYYYQYKTDGKQRSATLTVPCSEVNDFTEKRLLMTAMVSPLSTDSNIGVLSHVSSPTSIAILGNSFINSSSIGSILGEMLQRNGKNCSVDAKSRGYARVSTYTSDTALMNNIRSGKYDLVFICGLYATDEVSNLDILKSACKTGGAELVIFPAHNESSGAISSAKGKYSDIVCLDWKSEIDELMSERNMSVWDFCVDDQHRHSKPLAGYVGAHMIYRAIYGTVPSASLYSSISQDYVNSMLGDYVKTGNISLLDTDIIKYFANAE